MNFKIRLVLILLVLVSLSTISVNAQDLNGNWSGTVTQDNPKMVYAVEMTLNGSNGFIHYPILNCKGTLGLVEIKNGVFVYRETITEGDCITGGRLGVTPEGNRLMWVWTGQGVTVTGVLIGRRQITTPQTCEECTIKYDNDKEGCENSKDKYDCQNRAIREWEDCQKRLCNKSSK